MVLLRFDMGNLIKQARNLTFETIILELEILVICNINTGTTLLLKTVIN